MNINNSAALQSGADHAPEPQVLRWLIRGVFLESIRRREISVVFLFMGLFLVGAVVARIVGAETDAAASFILNLGLSLVWFLSLIVALLMAARQFPDELEQRSIYPLLAKPVSRSQYIAGKWLAAWIMGSLTALALNAIALVGSPWPGGFSPLLLIQAGVLEIMAIGLITALAMLASIRIPKAMAIVIIGLLAFAGAPLLSILRSHIGQPGSAGAWVIAYIPDFGRLDLINALSAAAPPITALDFLSRIISASIIIFFALAASMYQFSRRPL